MKKILLVMTQMETRLSEKEYTKDIHEALHQLSEGKLETYSSEEVRKKILG